MRDVFYTVMALFALTVLFTVTYAKVLIPALRRRRASQPILEIGPSWHLSKAGTPTMGGLAFIGGMGSALLIVSIVYLALQKNAEMRAPTLIFCYALCCGAIGFFDDFRKLTKRQNQGLTSTQKYLLQLLAAAIFLFAARVLLGTDTAVRLPFEGGDLELGVFYYPLALLFLTGLVNALNLTDGVDGLLSSTVAVLAVFFLSWGYAEQAVGTMIVGALLLGGTLGFLCFNAHPAKVFMGDTGSLFLGGAAGAVGIVTEHPLAVLTACGVFVAEAASVILQVVYFKISGGKRIFKMAPLHHHFEKCGWSEWRVVAVFSLCGALLAALAFWGR